MRIWSSWHPQHNGELLDNRSARCIYNDVFTLKRCMEREANAKNWDKANKFGKMINRELDEHYVVACHALRSFEARSAL